MPGNVILFFLFRLSLDVDKAEKDNRDKETKILNLTRELDEMRDMYAQDFGSKRGCGLCTNAVNIRLFTVKSILVKQLK
jgi:hypothetical protein